jgi:hypothetical protein
VSARRWVKLVDWFYRLLRSLAGLMLARLTPRYDLPGRIFAFYINLLGCELQ